MDQSEKRFISYICPSCRQSVIVERDVFGLAAAPTKIECPCGKSQLRIEFLPERVNLKIPCLACGREHTASCGSADFVKQNALAFSCVATGLNCCYIGEEGAVYAATSRLEKAIDKLESDKEQGTFLDELVMREVLEEVKEIAARDGISCSCGCKEWAMKVNFSSVDLNCPECGGILRIPASTADDIEDICCKYTLQIRGRREMKDNGE